MGRTSGAIEEYQVAGFSRVYSTVRPAPLKGVRLGGQDGVTKMAPEIDALNHVMGVRAP